LNLDDDKSVNSWEFEFDTEDFKLDYVSTNLISRANINVSDVHIEEITH
jgi:hypothetical protein